MVCSRPPSPLLSFDDTCWQGKIHLFPPPLPKCELGKYIICQYVFLSKCKLDLACGCYMGFPVVSHAGSWSNLYHLSFQRSSTIRKDHTICFFFKTQSSYGIPCNLTWTVTHQPKCKMLCLGFPSDPRDHVLLKDEWTFWLSFLFRTLPFYATLQCAFRNLNTEIRLVGRCWLEKKSQMAYRTYITKLIK